MTQKTRDDLEHRIAAALKGGGSATIRDLLPEVEQTAAKAREAAEEARAQALDPLLSAGKVNSARAEAQDADFRAQRLDRAAEALREALTTAEEREAGERRQAAYDDALVERDRVAERLQAEYPGLQAAFLDLLADLADASEKVLDANSDLPEGADLLEFPEGVARGLELVRRNPGQFDPVLAIETVIPDWSDPERVAWPPTFSPHNPHGNQRPRISQIVDARRVARLPVHSPPRDDRRTVQDIIDAGLVAKAKPGNTGEAA